MGNKQGSLTRSESEGALQDNLVKSNTRHGKDYDISGSLGKGDGFQLKKAVSRKYTKTERNTGGVAIKLFAGQSRPNHDFKTEAAILRRCDHPNIIKLFEITKVNSKMSLVLELCDGGSVLERLPYKEPQAAKIVKQVCSVVSYLHGKNIVHRDIECSNIMFASVSNESEVKLVDFGSACELETVPNHPGAYKFLKEKTGSVSVMAPEVIRGKYGPKADVWSIGVVAYTLLNNGRGPFKGTTASELEPKILQGAIDYTGWEHSEEAKAFCKKTCQISEAQRLPASHTLYDPWISGVETPTYNVLPVELVTSFNFYQMALPLKRIALNVLARKVKSSKYRELFEHLNKSKSGMMTKEEFLDGFKNSGSSNDELQDLYDKLDINNNGGITYTEFIAATLETGGELEEDQLREAFDLISSNRRYITPKDVETIVSESLKDRDNKEVVKSNIQRQMRRFSKKHKEEQIRYEDFAEMFEHGFRNIHGMDSIIETSLNAEQLRHVQETQDDDDEKRRMSGILEENSAHLRTSRCSGTSSAIFTR